MEEKGRQLQAVLVKETQRLTQMTNTMHNDQRTRNEGNDQNNHLQQHVSC